MGMRVDAPHVYAPRVPQLPYMPTPGIDLPGGGAIRGPNIQGPMMPQIPTSLPKMGGGGALSNKMLLIVIIALAVLLIGVVIALFLVKK